MATILPNPALQDLKLTFHDHILVFPSRKTENRSIYLSNIDQILNYVIPTVSFFSANPKFPPEYVAIRLKIALEKVLVPFDFMAGRLKVNQESGRLELDCNAAGAGFVVASSELPLAPIEDLDRPNLGFKQLSIQSLDNLSSSVDPFGQPLCIIQVTSFKCGGFSIGMSVNHILLDGISAKFFKENLASQAFDEDKPLPFPPCLDRTLLAPRSPPLVQFPHPEFSKRRSENPSLSCPPIVDCGPEILDYAIFKLRPRDINFLKDEHCSFSATRGGFKFTRLDVVAALVWKCKALSHGEAGKKRERVSTLLNVVDIRSRLDPPLPPAFCGNAVLCGYASAERGEMEEAPFWELVARVGEGVSRITSEYAKSSIDWLEINKASAPCMEYMVSSWLRLGFEGVAYPWGKPVYGCPAVSGWKDICWVFPDGGDGINALVSLPAKEMESFKLHFLSFFH